MCYEQCDSNCKEGYGCSYLYVSGTGSDMKTKICHINSNARSYLYVIPVSVVVREVVIVWLHVCWLWRGCGILTLFYVVAALSPPCFPRVEHHCSVVFYVVIDWQFLVLVRVHKDDVGVPF